MSNRVMMSASAGVIGMRRPVPPTPGWSGCVRSMGTIQKGRDGSQGYSRNARSVLKTWRVTSRTPLIMWSRSGALWIARFTRSRHSRNQTCSRCTSPAASCSRTGLMSGRTVTACPRGTGRGAKAPERGLHACDRWMHVTAHIVAMEHPEGGPVVDFSDKRESVLTSPNPPGRAGGHRLAR
jgi:hypothetical protein